MLIFDRARLRQNRLRTAPHFADAGVLFDEATAELIGRLEGVNRKFSRILDLGSRSYALAKLLQKQDSSRFIVHASLLPQRVPSPMHHLCVVDEEYLPFRGGAFDLVLSPLSLHWANDLPGALIQIRRTLKADGFFIGGMLGGETLRELRACFYEVEMKRRGGAAPHISPFAGMEDCGALLTRAGFNLPVVDLHRLTLSYPSSFHLMRELRNMGEGNVLLARDRHFLGKNFFAEVEETYQNRFGNGSGNILATFDMLFISGWAPDASQQIPLKPGAAQHRLSDALKTSETGLGDKALP
jgi:NADH dehydrogenase [ubiquinone] 1 alpha subcomplex assembly factor 5